MHRWWLQDPKAMPAAGPTLVLGYMKQFRAAFSLGAQGELMLAGRQVSSKFHLCSPVVAMASEQASEVLL
jgi:hypothetical protein